jgi:hypothetical protein
MQWNLVRVGCKIHTIEYWEQNWEAVARKHGVSTDATTAMTLLDKVRKENGN